MQTRHKGLYRCPCCGATYTHDEANHHAVYRCPFRKEREQEERDGTCARKRI